MDEITTCEYLGGPSDGYVEHLTPDGIIARIKLGSMDMPIMNEGGWDTGKKARYKLRKIDNMTYRYDHIKGKR